MYVYVAKVLFFKVNRHVCRFNFFYVPLHAEIKKYPLSVTELKSKCTTGLVCPLQVNGVWRKFAIILLGHWKYQQHNIPEFVERTDFDRPRSL